MDSIIRYGAASVNLIPENFLSNLNRQVRDCSFEGSFESRFQTEILKPLCGPAKELNDQLELLINEKLRDAKPNVLSRPYNFDSATVGRLLPWGEVSQHPDLGCFGLICFSLLDEGRNIYTSPTTNYNDFQSTKTKLSTIAGDVVFMRGLGFLGLNHPIYHQVTRKRTLDPSYSIVFRNQKGLGT